MSADPGTQTIRHSLDADQKDIQGGTETLVHEESGSNRMGLAIKFIIRNAADLLTLSVGMKIPGSNSDATEDNYFADHFHFTHTVGGTGSGAQTTYATGSDQQKVITVGPWFATPGEWLIKYDWNTNTGNQADIKALHTWTIGSGF